MSEGREVEVRRTDRCHRDNNIVRPASELAGLLLGETARRADSHLDLAFSSW